MGSTSDESTLLWRSNNPLKKKKETSSKFAKKPTHSLPQRPRIHSKERRASEQSLDQVENIAPSTTSTPFKRALLQNKCPNRCLHSLRKPRRSLRFSRGEGTECHAP